jgi:hypothetical protein
VEQNKSFEAYALQMKVDEIRAAILNFWNTQKQCEATIKIITVEIEELTEEMANLQGEALRKHQEMLRVSNVSLEFAKNNLEDVNKKRVKLHKIHDNLVNK